MDRIITASEANQKFSEMLRAVQSGETFTVTSRGRPVARITPPEDADKAKDMTELLAFLETLPRRTFRWTRDELYERRPEDIADQ